jgi:hypothetical protein
MLLGFYLPRWEKFFQALDGVLVSRAAFDQEAFDRDLHQWERRWADQHETYPTQPQRDALALGRAPPLPVVAAAEEREAKVTAAHRIEHVLRVAAHPRGRKVRFLERPPRADVKSSPGQ